MELFWWGTALVLMAVGLMGSVLPIFPGTTLILAAAIRHKIPPAWGLLVFTYPVLWFLCIFIIALNSFEAFP